MSKQSYAAAGRITDGKLDLHDRRGFLDAMAGFPEGAAVDVRVDERSRSRTLQQNRFWWSQPVRLCAEHCGYTAGQMHYALLGECFGYVDGPTGHPVPVKPSSSDLTVEEFTHLIEWVLTWAPTELGVIVPAPGEFL